MKKIFTLSLSLLAMAAASAQQIKPNEPFPEPTATAKGMKVLEMGPDTGGGLVYNHDVKYCTRDGVDLYLQVIVPKVSNGTKLPCIVYVPGSAWGKQNVYASVFELAKLAERGYVVALVEYRPSFVAPFPGQVQDAKTAIRFMRKNAARFKVDPNNLFVGGDSSGGHTALMVGFSENIAEFDTPDYNDFPITVNGIVDLFGPTDLGQMSFAPSVMEHSSPDSPEGMLIGKKNVQESSKEASKASPVTYITGNHKPAPVLIMHGSKDRKVPFIQSVELANDLDKYNYAYEFYDLKGADHEGYQFWTSQSFDIIDNFLKKYTTK